MLGISRGSVKVGSWGPGREWASGWRWQMCYVGMDMGKIEELQEGEKEWGKGHHGKSGSVANCIILW